MQLAAYCQLKPVAVSYAGLKDRHAVTSQWFSVHLPGKEAPDWHQFIQQLPLREGEQVRVLQETRHSKKLQRGALKQNRFTIRLRDLSDTSDQAFELLHQRCDDIAQQGVPNYFGRQRFGLQGSNLVSAGKHFVNPRKRIPRAKRSMYLSAARSFLFNCMLSERVTKGCWNSALSGDVFMIDGRSACFPDDGDESVTARLQANELHPTAAMWGEGDTMTRDEAARLEKTVLDAYPVFRDGLLAARVKQQRRACRLVPGELKSLREEKDFVLSFSLAAGSYATMVLEELFCELVEPDRAESH